MFEKMKLRQRILLGYLAPLVLLLGAMSLVFYNLQLATRVAAAMEAKQRIMDEADDLAYSLTKMQRAARGYLLYKNPTSRQTFLDNEKDFTSRGEKLTGLVEDPQQLEILRGMLSEGQGLIKLDNQFLFLVDAGKQAEAQALFRSGEGIKESAAVDAQWNRSNSVKPRS